MFRVSGSVSDSRLHLGVIIAFVISLLLNVQTAFACQMQAAIVDDDTKNHATTSEHALPALHTNASDHAEHSAPFIHEMNHQHLTHSSPGNTAAPCCDLQGTSAGFGIPAGDCCEDVTHIDWIGTTADLQTPQDPLLHTLAFEWIAPVLMLVAILEVPLSVAGNGGVIASEPWLAQSDPPVYQATERYRL